MAPRRSSVTGSAELERRLRLLGSGLQTPIGDASRRALRPMLAEAKALAPTDDRDLQRSLAIRSSKGTTFLGVRKSFRGVDDAAPVEYAHLAEWGRPAGADGQGEMRGTRFLTRTFDRLAATVIRLFSDELAAAIQRRAAKLGRKK